MAGARFTASVSNRYGDFSNRDFLKSRNIVDDLAGIIFSAVKRLYQGSTCIQRR